MKILTGLLIACLVNFSIGSALSIAAESAFIGGSIGVVDTHRHQIIPSKFSQINYLGLGLYQTTSINLPDQFSYGKIHQIYDHDGHLLKLKIPEGCTFDGLYWMGEKAEGRRQAEELAASPLPTRSCDLLKTLPADALLRIKKDNKFGICDVRGKLVVAPEYAEMEKPEDGLALFFTGEQTNMYGRRNGHIFNCAKHTLKALDTSYFFARDTKFEHGLHRHCENGVKSYFGKNGQLTNYNPAEDGALKSSSDTNIEGK